METDDNWTNELCEILDSLSRSKSGKVLSASLSALEALGTSCWDIHQIYISIK